MAFAEVYFTRAVVLSSSTRADIEAAKVAGDQQRAVDVYLAAVERSMDGLASAGMMYPYLYRFRTGQADELYRLVAYFPALMEAADTAIGYALAIDSRSAPLVAGRLGLLLRMGRCDEARQMADRLVSLAPMSARVREMAAIGCPA